MALKASRYNIFLETENRNKYIVYNTLNDSIAVVDDTTLEILKPHRIYKGSEDAVQELTSVGMLVDESFDEFDLVQYRYYAIKYDMNNLILNIMPTYACNLACPYCFQGSLKRSDTMDDLVEKSVLNFAEYMVDRFNPKTVTVILYGGEPLLYPQRCKNILKSIWGFAQSRTIGFHGKLITNGTLLSKDIIEELKPYLNGVQVSFDGSRATHDRTRVSKKGEPTYAIILRNLNLLEAARISTSVRINVSKENIDSITEILDDFVGEGLHLSKHICPYWGRIVVSTRFCRSYAPYCFHDAEWAKLAPKLWRELYAREFVYIVDNVMSENHPASCKAMSPSTYTIGPKGEVYNCLAFAGDPMHKIGDLESTGQLRLNSRFYRMMSRNPFEFEECRDCVYLPRCGGGCTALAYVKHNSYKSVTCPDGKAKMRAALRFYLETRFPEVMGVT